MISEQTLRKILRMRSALHADVMMDYDNMIVWTALIRGVYLEAEQSLQGSVLNIHITNGCGVLYNITPMGADEQSEKVVRLPL